MAMKRERCFDKLSMTVHWRIANYPTTLQNPRPRQLKWKLRF
ncbi:hypothetical protein SAMN02745146_1605 [Hymenobacter daecheongensis DSM 21074]|uniref:Uncharacterized protein n=1 Tax=Hymenobacter daecheongensis DSM 21074 TaxID=1121955 RepID=A0A1M6E8U9_9BACT|nr:hypothetical protein SAMN02745146_1605 [Hymenobacter daecheongensis DSM 21074]